MLQNGAEMMALDLPQVVKQGVKKGAGNKNVN
jgi:hypothetical protein